MSDVAKPTELLPLVTDIVAAHLFSIDTDNLRD